MLWFGASWGNGEFGLGRGIGFGVALEWVLPEINVCLISPGQQGLELLGKAGQEEVLRTTWPQHEPNGFKNGAGIGDGDRYLNRFTTLENHQPVVSIAQIPSSIGVEYATRMVGNVC